MRNLEHPDAGRQVPPATAWTDHPAFDAGVQFVDEPVHQAFYSADDGRKVTTNDQKWSWVYSDAHVR
jgi:hypothetical protein